MRTQVGGELDRRRRDAEFGRDGWRGVDEQRQRPQVGFPAAGQPDPELRRRDPADPAGGPAGQRHRAVLDLAGNRQVRRRRGQRVRGALLRRWQLRWLRPTVEGAIVAQGAERAGDPQHRLAALHQRGLAERRCPAGAQHRHRYLGGPGGPWTQEEPRHHHGIGERHGLAERAHAEGEHVTTVDPRERVPPVGKAERARGVSGGVRVEGVPSEVGHLTIVSTTKRWRSSPGRREAARRA
jgi:hypothetical protein